MDSSRAALAHAVLALIHPAQNGPLPVPLPVELHCLIRTHLRVHIARALLADLHATLRAALDALCDDCKSYYAHVFGPHVADWPVIQAGRGCRCTTIGVPAPPPCTPDACLDPDTRPSLGDKQPPAYFLAHLQHTLAAYAAMDPSFPYRDAPVSTTADLDALISRVLAPLGWSAIATSHRNWEFDNHVSVVPLSASPGGTPPISLPSLRLRLDLPIHERILADSPLHPTKLTYFPPLSSPKNRAVRYSFSPLSTGIVSALLFLAVTSPLAIIFALACT